MQIGVGINLMKMGVLGGDAGVGLGGGGTVTTPSITSPADDAVDIGLTPTITSSAFATSDGSDTHASSDWQVASDAGFTSIVQQSLDDATNKVSWAVPVDLAEETEYFVRVRHTGTVIGDSAWSSGVSFTTEAAPAYSAEATALFAAMSVQPDDTRKAAIDALISGMKTEGLWDTVDFMSVQRAADAQAGSLWWNDPAQTVTVVGSPVFTADRGYVGVPSTGYLDTGFNPSTDVVNASLNSMGMTFYLTPGVGTDTGAVRYAAGCSDGTSLLTAIPWTTANQHRSEFNTATSSNFGAGVSTRTGLHTVNRSAAGALQWYRNGAADGTDTDASSALPNQNLFALALNNSGSPSGGMNNQIGCLLVHSSWDATQAAAFDALWDAYLAATP